LGVLARERERIDLGRVELLYGYVFFPIPWVLFRQFLNGSTRSNESSFPKSGLLFTTVILGRK
jgi:hypothetical protein